jgi:hypothetical protein
MKRPGIASVTWFIAFVAVTALLIRQLLTGVPEKADDIIFSTKTFADSATIGTGADGYVAISGTLTGEGMPPTLEARVSSLEQKVDKLVDDSKEIKATLVTVRDYLNEIRGKISQLPTWWQGLLGIVAIAALVYAVARSVK